MRYLAEHLWPKSPYWIYAPTRYTILGEASILTIFGFNGKTGDIFQYYLLMLRIIWWGFLSVLSRGHIFVFIRKPSKGRKGFFSVQICQNTPILAFSANWVSWVFFYWFYISEQRKILFDPPTKIFSLKILQWVFKN